MDCSPRHILHIYMRGGKPRTLILYKKVYSITGYFGVAANDKADRGLSCVGRNNTYYQTEPPDTNDISIR
jgi:hypothetical protein